MRAAHPLSAVPRPVAIALALSLAALATAGCRGKVKPEECTRMMDRYLDMTIAADPQLASMGASQAAIVRDMKKELKKGERSYRQVQEQCESEVSRHEYDCAMDAKTPNDWEACIE